jgi:hypothetical protein
VSLWESGKRPVPPRYLKIYLDLGGDPAILAPQPDSPPPEESSEMPPGAANFVEPAPAVGVRGRIRRAGCCLRSRQPSQRPSRRSYALPSCPAASGRSCVDVDRNDGHARPYVGRPGPAHRRWDPARPAPVSAGAVPGKGHVVQDGDPWWYRLASSPWNDRYYATSDAFYNNGATSGSVDTAGGPEPRR